MKSLMPKQSNRKYAIRDDSQYEEIQKKDASPNERKLFDLFTQLVVE